MFVINLRFFRVRKFVSFIFFLVCNQFVFVIKLLGYQGVDLVLKGCRRSFFFIFFGESERFFQYVEIGYFILCIFYLCLECEMIYKYQLSVLGSVKFGGVIVFCNVVNVVRIFVFILNIIMYVFDVYEEGSGRVFYV